MGRAIIVGTVLLAPVAWPAAAAQRWVGLSPATLMKLAYAAFVSGALGYILWYHAIGRLGPVKTSAYSFGIPVVGVASAVIGLGEPFSAGQAAGALFVLAGVALARGLLRGPARGRASGPRGAGRPAP